MTFSSFLVGADTLLTECASVLLERGHSVLGIVTSTPRVEAWARSRNIPTYDTASDWKAVLASRPFDYLFAITHLALLPDDVVRQPRKMTINFHDGPLPKYAGLNTPAWALMNREPRYGITWHVVDAGVDTGDILEQAVFDVAPKETSLSINTRCFELGIESFRTLVKKLEDGTETRTPQDVSERTIFYRASRPPFGCMLDFEKSAEELEALVRALDFGPYPNPLGVAKIAIDGEPVLVTRAEAREAIAERGHASFVDGALVVGCARGSLAIEAAVGLDGQERRLDGLREPRPIQDSTELHERVGALNDEAAKSEPFWHRRLRELDPVLVPYANNDARPSDTVARVSVSLPRDLAPARLWSAIALYLSKLAQKPAFDVAFASAELRERVRGLERWFATEVPLHVAIDPSLDFSETVRRTESELERLQKRGTFIRDLVTRMPELRTRPELTVGPLLPIAFVEGDARVQGATLSFCLADGALSIAYDPARVTLGAAERLAREIAGFVSRAESAGPAPVAHLGLLDPSERERVLVEWNRTAADHRRDVCVHRLFEEQADRTPDRVAIVSQGATLTYRELDERSNRLAHRLRRLGVGPDSLVGVYVERSLDLMVATLGVQKAGGAYVPLDPSYPADRLAFMLSDSKASIVVSQRHLASRLPSHGATTVFVDDVAMEPGDRLEPNTTSANLAYVIYTSGSTGRPKGVMVEHHNVANFFRGMDDVIAKKGKADGPPVWLAVTSLSFDISVLELFWTLVNGFSVVLYVDHDRSATSVDPAIQNQPMNFGLFYWGNDDGPGPKKYQLLLEGAKFADKNGFNSVWTPERHFHAFGGPYPNPAVTGAAVAAVTKHVDIRAGSCVVPLHHPLRVAEEWAVVDNLSGGRVGLSIASGWQPDDFVLRPENAPPKNKDAMFRDAEIVRKLWRGEAVTFETDKGPKQIVTQPRPVQKELPLWVTTAGNPDTYRGAAKAGANVLTHLLGQSIAEVGEKIKIYREALVAEGKDPKAYKVTLMLHTFVGEDVERVRQIVHEPMKEYLRSAVALIKEYAWAFPAFKRPEGAKSALDVDLRSLSKEELDGILEFAFERYFVESGLFGTVESCLERVTALKKIGVDEVACLVDYGVAPETMLASLDRLAEVVRRANQKVASDEWSFAALVAKHGVSHFQATPSMVRMLLGLDETRQALASIDHVMVGGEAFPVSLARELRTLLSASGSSKGTVTNMYGPTETTIWSSTHRIESAPDSVPIGRPIANTSLFVLDPGYEPVPVGVAGELFIGGEGVVRGYHDRPELTRERFVENPFGEGRLYRTGDLARFTSDGVVEFLGRTDHQVKVRGYRIELGEIETQVGSFPNVKEAVVIAREDTPGDQRLCAYFTSTGAVDVDQLRDALRSKLPEYMVPGHFVPLEALPLTPNGKVDRKQLPAPEVAKAPAKEYAAPESELESQIADVWKTTLGRDRVGRDDNFFDIGGHSLLVVRMHRTMKETLAQPIALTDLYRFPTIRALATYLEGGGKSEELDKSADRAAQRREALSRRRRDR
jgi:natural product biosynthesis luciferase-like monooxygenase protein